MTVSSLSSSSSASNPLSSSTQSSEKYRGGKRGGKRSSRGGQSFASRSNGGKRSRRGGYTSATTYMQNVAGTGDSQWDRVFKDGASTTPNGNEIIGVQGQNSRIPASVASSGKMNGGKRRSKKGGYWSQVISQALVPFGLWGAQNMYSRRRTSSKGGKTRRHKH